MDCYKRTFSKFRRVSFFCCYDKKSNIRVRYDKVHFTFGYLPPMLAEIKNKNVVIAHAHIVFVEENDII